MSKHFLRALLFCVCVGISCHLHAKIFTPEEAVKIANDFFSTSNVSQLNDIDALELVQTSKKSDGTPIYYVFNAKNGHGFIIISADEKAIPIIGYSYESSFIPNNISDVTTTVLNNTVKSVKNNTAEVRKRLMTRSSSGKLIKTPEWSQETPFNNQIPNHRLVGCVGTAMATVMKYHNHPLKGNGSLNGVNFDVQYDWNNMRTDNYRFGYSATEAEAISTLMAHCAFSIKTDFGMSGSSAFEVHVPAALISYFDYDPSVSYKKRSETDRATWDAIIVNEIDEGRPVIYSGQDVSAGHAFVCDGYEMRGSVPYFHINWGWGGSANGYYSSDALNPTVSTSHNFNDQTTIIYNIKPSSSSSNWSPIHITSDERQIGMTSDVTNINEGTKFTIRSGAFKNISYNDFSGKIAVALFSSDGKLKTLLNSGKNLTLQSMQTMTKPYDFECIVPTNTIVANDDVIRMVTMVNGETEWFPVTGDLITINEIKAKGYTIPYFSIDIPNNIEGAIVSEADTKVIKGRDYSFKVIPSSPEKVVTVKANGFILTPTAENIYNISNVTSDQQISIIVQAVEDVVSKRNLWISAGGLENLISDTDAGTIKELTLYGTIDVRDFTFIRERMKLTYLDISEVNIVANGANPANAIPTKAFSGYSSLQQIILPKNLSTLKNGCFNSTGLKKIEIPASVSTYEYNIFLNCSNLSEVIVRRSSPAWVNWCVFNGTPKSKLVVPIGSTTAYKAKDYWKDFKNIVEENPILASSYMVILQETEGIKITSDSDNLEVAAGSTFSFTVETDNRFKDAKMEIYANTVKLNVGTDGRYTTTINANTMIHANFIYPTPIVGESSWKLTDSKGGVGLATDAINVITGKTFTIRANALAIPQNDAAMFYAAVLTDIHGAIKEFISPIFTNSGNNYGDLPCTFNCQVKESLVCEGNLVRIVTSYNKNNWYLVKGTNHNVKDSIQARGNEVIYHKINIPSAIQGATIQGAIDQIVHGMDFSCKIMPVSIADAITVSINGKIVADRVGVAQIKVESVREDLDIAIQVVPAGDETYTALNIHAGELSSKISASAFPSRLKLMGEMNMEDFKVLQENAAKLIALDLTDVTIKSYPNPNSLPSMAFASATSGLAALTTIHLPKNLESIEANAFYRCIKVKELTIPETVSYIGENAFSMCANLKKIVVLSKNPVILRSNPFPMNTSDITLEVPKGAEEAYGNSTYWKELNGTISKVYYNIQIDPERVFQYSDREPLTKIEGPEGGSTKTVMLGLPNFKPTSYKKNPVYRPGVAFKLYNNKCDVTGDLDPLSSTDVFHPGGYYQVKFYGYVTNTEHLNYPQDHVIDVVFYYNIKINDISGIAKINFVDIDENNIWRDVEMNKFIEGSSLRPTLFKEGGTYKFTVTSEKPNMTPVVKEGDVIIYPDENGVYTITNLQSDVEMNVTMTLIENNNVALEAEDVLCIGKEEAAQITKLDLSGELTKETFDYIREKFMSLEDLDLSATTNNEIPSKAFTGMSNLLHVTVPENVTSIGENAFENCSQLHSISLSSVNSIGNGAFKGCSSLTSIMLYGNSQTIHSRSLTAGINDSSFEGLNPNCIIYLAKGLESQITSKSNIVLNGEGKCEALTDIILTDSCTFNIPASFNLGNKSISLSIELNYLSKDGAKEWKGLVLPFIPTRISDENGNEYTIGKSGNQTISILSFNKDGEKLENQTSIVANTPYMMHLNGEPNETVKLTFTADNISGIRATANTSLMFDVPLTPDNETIMKEGKNFCLYGNYTPVNADTNMYVLNADRDSFNRVTNENTQLIIAPFSVYAKANSTMADNSFEIGKADITTDISTLNTGKLKLYKNGSNLVIVSDEKRNIEIFTILGVHVTSQMLEIGHNTILLKPGIYIIDGIKVIL